MVQVTPFRALRPRPELAVRVASLPYDVLSTEEARAQAAGNPQSFLHVTKPEIDLPSGTDLYADEVYAQAQTAFRRLRDEGVFVREDSPTLYLYQQKMGDHVQIGVVGGVSVDAYEQGGIKKHEHTRRVKEDDRTRHMAAIDANAGPVFLTYRARPELDALVARCRQATPVYDFTSADGIQHTVWVLSSQDRDAFVSAFAEVPELYVADGHHRAAAAVRVRGLRRDANPSHRGDEPYNFFLAVMFPHDQMYIMDYNRVVRDLRGLTPAAFLEAIAGAFEVEPATKARPDRPRTFGMYLDGRWYRLRAREGSFPADDPTKGLDVAILQDNLLAPVLGIHDPRTDERIDFVGGIRGTDELARRVDEGEAAVAFALHPTAIGELFAVADAGEVMPPKSTWFEPKLRSGLLVRPLFE